MIRPALVIALAIYATAPAAQSLNFPSNAKLMRETAPRLDSYAMPIGPWSTGAVPTQTIEGQFSQQAWKITATGLSSLQIIRPLRDQLRNAGFDVIFECQDAACGGFDFRFAMPVLPPPEMQVNLGDFRYLAARKESAEGPVLMSLLASRSARAGFVQLSRVGPTQDTTATATADAIRAPITAAQSAELAEDLLQSGRAVLTGLDFGTGSSQLGTGPFETLETLANLLAEQPDLKVALVGHTDSSGTLDGNIALSKRRAGSVLERLATAYGVNRTQLEAQGMGYLAPIASNQTQDGRTANRRVEVIVTSTD